VWCVVHEEFLFIYVDELRKFIYEVNWNYFVYLLRLLCLIRVLLDLELLRLKVGSWWCSRFSITLCSTWELFKVESKQSNVKYSFFSLFIIKSSTFNLRVSRFLHTKEVDPPEIRVFSSLGVVFIAGGQSHG